MAMLTIVPLANKVSAHRGVVSKAAVAVSCSSSLTGLPARRDVIEVGLSQVFGSSAVEHLLAQPREVVLLEGGDRIDR